jgi:hypothetical protein
LELDETAAGPAQALHEFVVGAALDDAVPFEEEDLVGGGISAGARAPSASSWGWTK